MPRVLALIKEGRRAKRPTQAPDDSAPKPKRGVGSNRPKPPPKTPLSFVAKRLWPDGIVFNDAKKGSIDARKKKK